MFALFNKYRKSEEGFTLIELIVVILIIGILAAIAVPLYLEQQKLAIAASVKSDARNTVNTVQEALVRTPNAQGFVVYSVGEAPPTAPNDQTAVIVVESAENIVVVVDPADAGDDALSATSNGAWDGYVVHAESPKTGYWYEFDSTTGLWSDGTTTPGGGAGGPGGPGGPGNGTAPATNLFINGGGSIHPDYELLGTQGASFGGGGFASAADAATSLPAFTHSSFPGSGSYPLTDVQIWIEGVAVPVDAGTSFISGSGDSTNGYSFALLLGQGTYDFIVGDGRNIESRYFFHDGTISFTANGQSGNVVRISNSESGFNVYQDREEDRRWASTFEAASVDLYDGSSSTVKTLYFYDIYAPAAGVSTSNLSSMPTMASGVSGQAYPVTNFSGTYANGTPIPFTLMNGSGGEWGTFTVDKNSEGKVIGYELNPYFAEYQVDGSTDNTTLRNNLEGATFTFTANGQTNTMVINRQGTGILDQSVSDWAFDILNWQ